MKILFHCHTDSSKCSKLSQGQLVRYLDDKLFDAVFVTDHNKVTVFEWARGRCILAEEIATGQGDLIGIFIKECIQGGLGMEKTIAAIHAQGGLAVAPHPADILRRESMGIFNFLKFLRKFDIIEVYNSRNLIFLSDIFAKVMAKINKKPIIVGADAHFEEELKNAYIEIDSFDGAKDFLNKLSDAKFHKKRAGIGPHVKTVKRKYFKKKS